MDGMFSFVLLDESTSPSRIIAARDPIGITTLYQGWSSKRPDSVYFASELKALVDDCDRIISFPPGHVYDSRDASTTRYYQPSWWDGDQGGQRPTTSPDLSIIRETLEDAVRKRLMSEVPYGVLLSGGLDSSLIAAIASRETEKVAQAQHERRQKQLQEARSGPSTPTPGLIGELGGYQIRPASRPLGDVFGQRPSLRGRSSIHSLSASRTRPTCWRQEKQLTTSGLCTTNTSSPCRKAWMLFLTWFTTWKPTTSRRSAPAHQCIY